MPTITGTATYDRVEVRPRPDTDVNEVEVVGYYKGETTTYRSPLVFVDGLEVATEGQGEILLSPDERDWVWVVATKERLTISSAKPQE